VYKRCACRDSESGKRQRRRCPKFDRSDHGGCWFMHDVLPGQDKRRRRTVAGPFATEGEAEVELAKSLAQLHTGGRVEADAGSTVAQRQALSG
jgi:hypothetical protein